MATSLAEQIRKIEERFAGVAVRTGAVSVREDCPRLATGWADIDAVLGGGLALAALHEWFGVAPSQRLMACREEETRGDPWIPPLLPIVHLAHQTLRLSSFLHHTVWIGRRCFPYGGAIVGAGNDRRLLERSLFVTADRSADRVWAADLSLRSPAVGMVVADGSGFDMAATRRIQLVAREHRKPVLLVRPPWDLHQLSAARTRWVVRWEKATDGRERDSNALNPRWSFELLRCKDWLTEYRRQAWMLEWDRGEGALRVLAPLAGATSEAGASTDCHRRHRA